MTYQLRRLRLHGLIERMPRSHRYRLTDFGRHAALFLPRLYARAIRPALSLIDPQALPVNHRLQRAFQAVDLEIHSLCQTGETRRMRNLTHSEQLWMLKYP